MFAFVLTQDGHVQEAALLRARPVDDAEQEERTVERQQPVQEADRVHRAEGHEQRLMTAHVLDRISISYMTRERRKGARTRVYIRDEKLNGRRGEETKEGEGKRPG